MAKTKANGVMKKLKRRQGGRNLYGIKQGVGKVTQVPFPTLQRQQRVKRRNGNRASYKYALNAMHPCHLPLPRAVGGYTVIRTTDIVNTNAAAILFGCFKGPRLEFTETTWQDVIAVNSVNATVPINDVNTTSAGTGNASFSISSALSSSSISGARMVPAAITVQVMNGESLQSADGIAYIGRSKVVLDLMGDSRTWDDVMKELVAYSSPRLCSAGKLALRGVQVDAVPNNMSVLSDFVPRAIAEEGVKVWRHMAQTNGYAADFEGFGPIFVYNPDRINLKYLVTIEWRMRFDPLNPAYAGHVQHQPASESTWSKVISDAESLGNGVMDIADVTADVGVAAMGLAPFMA
jgi:hypothetical protein